MSENTWTEENETATSNDSFASNMADYTIYVAGRICSDGPVARDRSGRGQGMYLRILDGTTFQADYFQKLRLDQGIMQISYQTEQTRETEQKKPLAPSAAWIVIC